MCLEKNSIIIFFYKKIGNVVVFKDFVEYPERLKKLLLGQI